MQELVAGILRAMGYRTEISPPGSDRGKDIFASKDGLGLDGPRIFVEVKHRKGTMGAPEVRSFLGGRQEGSHCLYVSTGGFTKEAHYEEERSKISIKLLDLDDLASFIKQYYDDFDSDTKILLPLTKIYWPSNK
jgi:restriction system protein